MTQIYFTRLPHYAGPADKKFPAMNHENDAGMDFYASESLVIGAGMHTLVPTGIRAFIVDKAGVYLQIFGRSGLTAKTGVLIGAGVIDSGYSGEIKVVMVNPTGKPIEISRGDRIAQGVLLRTCAVADRAEEISEIEFEGLISTAGAARGSNGFGSSGK